MIKKINEMFEKFGIGGEFVRYKMFKSGHINTTCMVTMEEDGEKKSYVLQKINKNVFKRPNEVMENIVDVTSFIENKLVAKGENPEGRVLKFLPATDNNYYAIDNEGEYWRVYDFVDKSITFDSTENLELLRETGEAFGEFQNLLADYPRAGELFDIIPNFHNTPKRYETFREVLAKDPVGRAESVQAEINAYLDLEETACTMQGMLDEGKLPLRVTHNDTKCNNVLFDENTQKHMCVIDLDTVMPGLVGFDFGDAIRFAANTCAEDEVDTSKVKVDLDKFRAFTEGFVAQVGDSLTPEEIRTLPLGAITMTSECGLRFLTDYIDGDNYFGISYPEHNIVRSRCQLALAQDLVRNRDKMQSIVDECVKGQSQER